MDGDLTARITGSGSFLPEKRLDNYALYEMESIRRAFDLERARSALRDGEGTDELNPEEVFHRWALQVTGIRERRVLDPETGMRTEQMCAEAARRALEVAGLEPGDLDLIIVGSVTPSDEVPNMACTVAELLGVPRLGGYTLNAACAAFVYAVAAGWSAIRSGLARRVLVIAGDALSRITDYEDPKTAVLFGDGAGAVVLEAARRDDGVLGTPYLGGDYDRDPLFLEGRSWMEEDEPNPKLRMGGGPQILRQAIGSMAEAADRALQTTGRGWDEVDLVIPHQANLRITRGLEKQLRMSRGRVLHTIQEYGNMSASTVGVTLDEALRGRHGPLPDPALIVLTAVGGGYTTGGIVIRQAALPVGRTPEPVPGAPTSDGS